MGEYLPPGFRFYPTEEELVSFYLYNKLEGKREDLNRVVDQIIPVLDIYHFNPWDLPLFAGEVCKRDEEQWFFFIPRQESEARGGRPKRVTSSGYWKATGSPSYVYSSNNNHIRSIGVKRSMVFYTGRAPHGSKTEWKMNEYKLTGDPSSSNTTIHQLSLCRIYNKSKSLRAFDRRPPRPPLPMAAQSPAEPQLTTQQYVGDDQFIDDQTFPNIPPLLAERPSSSESFSSGDHHGESSAAATTNNMQSNMDVDNNELIWDWNCLSQSSN